MTPEPTPPHPSDADDAPTDPEAAARLRAWLARISDPARLPRPAKDEAKPDAVD